MKRRAFFITAATILLCSVALYVLNKDDSANRQAKALPFATDNSTGPVISSKEKLNQYFKRVMKEERSNFSLYKMEESTTVAEDSSGSSENSAQAFDASETNNQVQGVDEADLVKTNGSHIFQVVDGKVHIIETNDGDDMKLLHSFSFPDHFSPSELFLHGDKLLIVGHSYEEMEASKKVDDSNKMMIAPINEMTKAIVFNIKDPSNPKEERTISLEGHIVSMRKIDGKVYVVTNQFPQYWLLRENEDVDLRPRYTDSTVSGENLSIGYDQIHIFPQSKEGNYTIIAAFDLENPEKEAKITTYLGGGNQLYMSKENLYIALQNWEIRPLSDRPDATVNTTIYKYAIDNLNVDFVHSTEIEGTILNQFSMDEHNGYFRVVTTEGSTWNEGNPSANHLFIFDERLEKVSSIEDLARGERIYSARFMGEKIYMVTFKETDPLFVIDASKPEKPEVLGELKIPGFSNYLHPFDENHLIGFGHDTKVVPAKDSSEPLIFTEGVKLSLFDVSDMKNPQEKFTKVIGGRGTYSPLNHDHKALLFDKEKNIFAFPINIYEEIEGENFEEGFKFQGAHVYNIDLNQGFQLRSEISHMKGKQIYEEWHNEIRRLLYIDDTLYVLSNAKITSHSLADYKLKDELIMN
ncbi:beta-propeller domain-containing protein [Robertmurraya sp. DFI.2.37]|uniref:beta-propeller domain-containing protein n=1 Tax=Robertmurraya sp. DFI.2.37 TaxID=3031819 RepID=UPI0012470BDB|nr:beta-propeller domain-containing protein [Robertmurraya sp. DFI.2.37]MDF1509107.1 beta-propeller domain-containing protein [Robertmurraya sp. DFI.2.37]